MDLARQAAILTFMKYVNVLLWVFVSTLISKAESSESRDAAPEEFRLLLGEVVVADALVWHFSKGVSGRILLPTGHAVYVSNFFERDSSGRSHARLPQGKLVRIVGRLSYETIPPTSEFVQGYGSTGFKYLALEMESFAIIEVVELPKPRLSGVSEPVVSDPFD